MEKIKISKFAALDNVNIAPSACIFDAFVKNTIVGDCSIIRDGSRIENSSFGVNVDL